jgi:hypothetical protein
MSEPRVLIVVSGGVADCNSDKGVDVVIFDWDNFRADPVGTDGVPEHFRDLAESWVGLPIGGTLEERFPLCDWQYEVANGDTTLGYEMWAFSKAEEASHA